jgi:hypothetical protein
MRVLGAIIIAATTLFISTGLGTESANAYVCGRGYHRAGCVGPRGAVVARRPAVAACRVVWVNGVRVRRCY